MYWYCPKCGNENAENAQFCAGCGAKTSDKVASANGSEVSFKQVYYSTGWRRAKTLAVAVVPQFDLMVDEKNFYVLKLPSSYAPVWGFFIGLVVLRFVGMLVGAAIGEAIANAKRKSARATWMDENGNLISAQYEDYIFLRIPLNELKQHLAFEKGKYLVVKYDTGKLVIRKGKKEYRTAQDYLNKYVL